MRSSLLLGLCLRLIVSVDDLPDQPVGVGAVFQHHRDRDIRTPFGEGDGAVVGSHTAAVHLGRTGLDRNTVT